MAPIILFAIALLALILWTFMFAALRCRPLARAISAQQRRHNNLPECGSRILDLGGVGVIAGNRFENRSKDVDQLDREDRAKNYLRRIVALTCAKQMDDAYVLDVGKMRFHVRDRHVTRLRDLTDPRCASEKTCFYLVHKGMPKEEEIATALLQLASNPALFDKWAVRNELAIKADGEVFSGSR
jgi:hypothetical protein